MSTTTDDVSTAFWYFFTRRCSGRVTVAGETPGRCEMHASDVLQLGFP